MKDKSQKAGKLLRITKREAEVLMMCVDMAVRVYGTPDCPKCERALFSAAKKFDSAFKLGVFSDAEAS